MIEESARVVSVEDGIAWVETLRKSACDHCEANKGCGTATLSKVLGQSRTHVKVLNPVGAKAGEQVIIGIEEKALVRGSMVIYAVPLISMIVFALGGEALKPFISSGDGLTVLAGILGLAVGFGWVRRFAARIRLDEHYQPVILRRVTPITPAPDGVFVP